MKLWIGLGGKASSHKEWRTWKSNDAAEFDVPEEFRTVKEIWIKGKAEPNDRNVVLHVYFKERRTQKMEFDDKEEHEISQGDE